MYALCPLVANFGTYVIYPPPPTSPSPKPPSPRPALLFPVYFINMLNAEVALTAVRTYPQQEMVLVPRATCCITAIHSPS